MFRGSSCTQTSSSGRWIPGEHRAQLGPGEGVELLQPDDRRAARRPASPPRPAGRSRPCRCRAPAGRPAPGCSRTDGVVEHRLQACPSARSSSRELACGRRSRLLGVMTTSGRWRVRRAWRRSRWKYCAGVVRVGDPDVALGGELEEALQPGARVLRALALVAVRQQQREPRGEPPLGEPRRRGTGRRSPGRR